MPHRDVTAQAFVGSVCLAMILVVVVFLVKYGRPEPLTEDWLFVPALTGNEPGLLGWLWEQSNEHRVPLPKLLVLTLLKASAGDFRIGMIFNILTLSGLAIAMVLVARHLRGGHTRYTDAFFPIALLHMGHAENLFWTWQMTVIAPTVAACAVLLVLIADPELSRPIPVVVAVTCLVSLPLSGLNGIIYAPILGAWLGYRGFRYRWRKDSQQAPRWIGVLLLTSSVVTVVLTGVYFIGYQRPAWAPPPPNVAAWMEATFKFLAMGFGPAATASWLLSGAAAIIFFGSAVTLTLLALVRNHHGHSRAGGLLIFLGAMAVFAVGVGWGRAAAIPVFGRWPLRYSLFAVPALCATFYVWELYGPRKLRLIVPTLLLVVMILVLPVNNIRGLAWIHWFHERHIELQRDLFSGASELTLAEKHKDLLHRYIPASELAHYIDMLRKAGYEPFVHIAQNPKHPVDHATGSSTPAHHQAQAFATTERVTHEIRYTMPEAASIYLVWGFNGWSVAPDDLRPPRTELRPVGPKKTLMHTEMVRQGDTFSVTLIVPVGASVDYGFLITKTRGLFDIDGPIWIGGYWAKPAKNDIVEIRPGLVKRLARLDLFRDLSNVAAHKRYFLAGLSAFLVGWLVLLLFLSLFRRPNPGAGTLRSDGPLLL